MSHHSYLALDPSLGCVSEAHWTITKLFPSDSGLGVRCVDKFSEMKYRSKIIKVSQRLIDGMLLTMTMVKMMLSKMLMLDSQ